MDRGTGHSCVCDRGRVDGRVEQNTGEAATEITAEAALTGVSNAAVATTGWSRQCSKPPVSACCRGTLSR